MIEPQRLLDDPELAEEAAQLLRALPVPEEPNAAKTAALAEKLAQLASAPGAPPSPAAPTAPLLKLAFLLGAVGLTAASFYLVRTHEPPRIAPHALASEAPSRTPSTPSILPPPLSAKASTSIEPSQATASATSPAPSSRAQRDTLAAEEALLEQARKDAASSPAHALALLEQYKRQFPHGQLAAERMFLSADVLSRLGNEQAAQRERNALVRAFPRSVYAAQVKSSSSSSPR